MPGRARLITGPVLAEAQRDSADSGARLLPELHATAEQNRAPELLSRAAQELDVDERIAACATQRWLLGEGDRLPFGNQHHLDRHVRRGHVRELSVVREDQRAAQAAELERPVQCNERAGVV